jgi:sugar phosphate isomerase/epimerase
MCYDVGHAYCYDNVNELFIRFKDKIVCSHLHNNFGSDTHQKLLEGLIDIKGVINKLNKENIDNCLEVFPLRGKLLNNSEFREFISDCIKDYKSCLRN